ncbi:hypothetical protein JQ574_34180 [Bradyrhizobium sp. AUGA SZCCT0158]|uniref:hypothetical protein n=1 Tax=Bradyrhizobium sp. AUGA SZCCT0158 TaxID=2807661 RepID=UPI001BAB0594|nr:hypothetical protein [Bradyrhizobium sp. AUGA SZCCT0158]MBR1201052.1 hypothetical protein [Bradyrhizobium sp. AUGA SZCCT0158]
MEDEQAKRLSAIVERRKKHAVDLAAKERSAKSTEEDRERRIDQAKAYWERSRLELTLAVSAVNANLADGGLKLRESFDAEAAPAIARIHISVDVDGKRMSSGPKLRINVSALGKGQSAFLLTGDRANNQTDFEVVDADQRFYTELLTSFLEKCL